MNCRSSTPWRSDCKETESCKDDFVKTFEAISAEQATKASWPVAKTDRRHTIYSSTVADVSFVRRSGFSETLTAEEDNRQ